MSEPKYNLMKEARDTVSGWAAVAKNLTLKAAEAMAARREALTPWAFHHKNPDRVYHLIEPV